MTELALGSPAAIKLDNVEGVGTGSLWLVPDDPGVDTPSGDAETPPTSKETDEPIEEVLSNMELPTAPVPVTSRSPVDLTESATMPPLGLRGVTASDVPSGGSRPEAAAAAREATAARAAAMSDVELSELPPQGWFRLPATARGGRSPRVGVASVEADAVGGGGGGGGEGGALKGTMACMWMLILLEVGAGLDVETS